MNKDKQKTTEATRREPPKEAIELRRQAEERLKERNLLPGRPQADQDLSRLVHELQVHQIELEMQNEELRQAQEEIEAGLRKYTDLYDFAPVGYFTLGRDGAIHQLNLTGARLLGAERSRLINRRFGSLLGEDPPCDFDAFLTRLFESQTKESCQAAIPCAGNRPLQVRIEATVAEDGRTCRAAVVDITDHLQAEEVMLIKAKLESTGVLAGGIAHDFNNLLTVILGNLEVAGSLASPGPEMTSALNYAGKAASMARALAQQLITFAKGGAPVRQLISLPGLLADSVAFSLLGSPVQCEFSIASDLAPVNADPGQVGQVIRNVVLNAREAMPEGGTVSIQARNVVVNLRPELALPDGNYVQISISDQGGGIPKGILTKIFDPYFTTKAGTDRKGMGLGLTVCYSVMRKHGGTITVAPNAGGGAIVDMFLPATLPTVQARSADTTSPDIPTEAGRILVMDDEESVRAITGALLQRRGYEVTLAESGEKAIEFYQAAMKSGTPFQAVILDLVVRGGKGGVQTLQALIEIDPSVKAIVLSGYSEDPVLLDFAKYGFKGALAKPYKVAELCRTLTRL